MKIAKALLISCISVALTIYLGVFIVWLMLTISCLQYVGQRGWSDNECGQDSLTRMVRTTHAPLIALMFGSNKK